MSVGAVPIIDDEEEDQRPLPVGTMAPVEPSDIKITPAGGEATPTLAPEMLDALAAQMPDNPAAGGGLPDSTAAVGGGALPDLTPTPVGPENPSSRVPGEQFPNAELKASQKLPVAADAAVAADREKIRQAELVAADSKHAQARADQIDLLAQKQAEVDQRAADAKAIEEMQAAKAKAVDAAMAEKQKAFDAWKATPFRDLYAERSVGDRIFGALAVFLGGAGGRHNDALDILRDGMQHAYDKQAADIKKKWDVYGEKTKDVAGAADGAANAMADLKFKQAARWEVNAAELARLKEKQGLSKIDADRDTDVIRVAQEAAKYKQEGADETRKTVEERTAWHKPTGTGSGGGGYRISELMALRERMTREGATTDQINVAVQKRAEDLHIPPDKYLPVYNAQKADANTVGDDARGGKKGGGGDGLDVFGPGGKVVARVSTGDSQLDRTRAKELSAANSAARDIFATLGELEKEIKEGGVTLPTIGGISLTDKSARREALHSKALLALKEAARLGVLSVGDIKLVEGQLGSAFANSAGLGASRLGELRRMVVNSHARFLDSNGLDGADIVRQLGLSGDGAQKAKPTDAEAARTYLARAKGGGGNGGTAPTPPTQKYSPAVIEAAQAAVKPDSGATPAQIAKAEKILATMDKL